MALWWCALIIVWRENWRLAVAFVLASVAFNLSEYIREPGAK